MFKVKRVNKDECKISPSELKKALAELLKYYPPDTSIARGWTISELLNWPPNADNVFLTIDSINTMNELYKKRKRLTNRK